MNNQAYDSSNGEHSVVVQAPSSKTRITIRIDTAISNWFRTQVHDAGGGNYQTSIYNASREYIHNSDGAFEDMLRKVIREELQTIAE